MARKATNIVWHERKIKKGDREARNGHKGVVIWFTGLSGSGKSTICVELEKRLYERNVNSYVLDGDNVRHGLNKNLGFTPEDRTENIRRIGEVAGLFADAGVIALSAFISPYRSDREQARAIMKEGEFVEVFVKADIETCKHRDPKGLYKLALEGKIKDFTGISAPYEEPENPEIVTDTTEQSLEESVQTVLEYLIDKEIIPV